MQVQTAERVYEVMEYLGTKRCPLTRVYRNLYNRDLYLNAYDRLSKRKGALTKGTTDETIDGMSQRRIERLIEKLRNERFHFSPSRRTKLKKKSGGYRFLSMPGFEDKLVQEVIRSVLSPYYEPQFSDNSHGFRPNRGCHTALRQVVQKSRACTWFIEGDISGCFDNIDHNKLLEILGRQVKDNRLLELIRRWLNAGYMDEWEYRKTYSGTPQGGVLSPLMANIYLNELDQFLETELLPVWNKGKKRRANSEYNRLTAEIAKARSQDDENKVQELTLLRRTVPSMDTCDPGFRRMSYVRYADDFLISFTGTKAEAREILAEVEDFLRDKLGFNTNESKSKITHARSGQAKFLGYGISIHHSNEKLSMGSHTKRRCINGIVRLGLPTGYIRERSKKHMANGKPIHRTELIDNSIGEIIQVYQIQLRGIYNYYQYAEDVHRLYDLKHSMQASLVQTIARKKKLTARKVYQKYGRKIMVNGKGMKVLEYKYTTKSGKEGSVIWGGFSLKRRQTHMAAGMEDTAAKGHYSERTDLIRRLIADKCEVCGKEGECVVHHIRKLKDLKKRWRGKKAKPAYVLSMIALRRKTLVVCHDCHQQIHHQTYIVVPVPKET
jgi:group II intron reverse transcriptase/maturase